MVQKGVEIHVVAPWVSYFRKGSEKLNGITIHRTYPKLSAAIWLYPVKGILRWWYRNSTAKRVQEICQQHGINAVFVFQARETGVAALKMREKVAIPVAFLQITPWKRRLQEPPRPEHYLGKFRKVLRISIVRFLIDHVITPLVWNRKFQARATQAIYRNVDLLLVPTEALKEEAVELGASPGKIEVVLGTIDTSIFKPYPEEQIRPVKRGLGLDKEPVVLEQISWVSEDLGFLLSGSRGCMRTGRTGTGRAKSANWFRATMLCFARC
jgi:glycosyltransferase involved in cell wall biosynthesis